MLPSVSTKVCMLRGLLPLVIEVRIMKNKVQNKAYAVYTSWSNAKVFANYEEAWKFAEKVYAETGNVIAVEVVR